MKPPRAKSALIGLLLLAMTARAVAIMGPGEVRELGSDAKIDDTLNLEIADYSGALDQSPPDAKKAVLLFKRGMIYFKTRQWDKAVDDITGVIAITPDDAGAHTMLGNAYFQKGNMDTAKIEYDEVIRLTYNNAAIHNNLAKVDEYRSDYGKAAAEYSEAIRLEPDNAAYCILRGGAYRNSGRMEMAIADYKHAIQLAPSSAEAYCSLAEVYEDNGDREKAVAGFTESIRLQPGNATPYLHRGLIHKQRGEYAPALDDLLQTVQLDPKSDYAFNQMGWILATCPDDKLRDGKKAIEYAQRACDLMRQNGNGSTNYVDTLAAAYAEAGKFAGAVATEERYIGNAGVSGDFLEQGKERLALYKAGKPYREKK